jgi:hypothetical protein
MSTRQERWVDGLGATTTLDSITKLESNPNWRNHDEKKKNARLRG